MKSSRSAWSVRRDANVDDAMLVRIVPLRITEGDRLWFGALVFPVLVIVILALVWS